MSWNVVILPKARKDYYFIIDYLSNFYPSTPNRFHFAYKKILRQLEFNPFGWSVYYDHPAYRRALIGKYTLLYKIDDERHEVHIHRIIRSNWDISELLQKDDEPGEEN